MPEIILKTQLHRYATAQQFVDDFKLGPSDLILTNEYIYMPHFGHMGLNVHIIYQEQYGKGEPTDVMVDAILADAAKSGCSRIIAIGGGTVVDIAKVMAVSNGEGVDELYAIAPDLVKHKELIVIPTTCGTGSEVTALSIINRTRMGTKLGLVGNSMFPEHAVLIPELLKGLPFGVFATSSLDALVHAVESALSPKATPYTKLFSYKAIEMIICGYRQIALNGQQARMELLEDFLIASNYAGIAFGTAGCAAVHALSYPLSGKYHVPHGESNYALFTGVLEQYRLYSIAGEMACLSDFLQSLLGCDEHSVWIELDILLNKILKKKSLCEYGVTCEDLPGFVNAVINTQQRLMANNFASLNAQDVHTIYSSLL